MRKCKIGIIGFGTVGKGIYRILKSKKDVHPILKDIEIVGIAVKNINKKRDIDLENNLTAKLGLNVLIDHKGKKGGSIKIEYKSLDQLELVTAKLKN